MCEGYGVLVILGVIIVFLHDVSTVVVVLFPVLICVFVVEKYADVIGIVVLSTIILAYAEVYKRVGLVLAYALFPDIAVGYRVEVGVVVPVLQHGLAHLIGCKLHRSKGVTVESVIEQSQLARVGLDDATVQHAVSIVVGKRVLLREREIFQSLKLCHEVACYVTSGLRVLDFAEISCGVSAQY